MKRNGQWEGDSRWAKEIGSEPAGGTHSLCAWSFWQLCMKSRGDDGVNVSVAVELFAKMDSDFRFTTVGLALINLA